MIRDDHWCAIAEALHDIIESHEIWDSMLIRLYGLSCQLDDGPRDTDLAETLSVSLRKAEAILDDVAARTREARHYANLVAWAHTLRDLERGVRLRPRRITLSA